MNALRSCDGTPEKDNQRLDGVNDLVGGEGHLKGLELVVEDVDGLLLTPWQAERALVRRLEVLYLNDGEVDRFAEVLDRDGVLKFKIRSSHGLQF